MNVKKKHGTEDYAALCQKPLTRLCEQKETWLLKPKTAFLHAAEVETPTRLLKLKTANKPLWKKIKHGAERKR